MACFYPLKASRALEANESGKRSLVFDPKNALVEGSSMKLPCGQCRGCRADRAREWAIRCGHEARMHSASCFITLTYDEDHVPRSFSVDLAHWQKFMRRLRKRSDVPRIRFYACGEYGDDNLRPHYHALIFGFDFPDKVRWANRNGNWTFKSKMLEELWPYGMCEIGAVTHQSAGYVARYVQKKMNGPVADDHYTRISPIDGEVYRVASEFATMSVKPGIGATWYERFKSDAFPSDFIVVDGRKMRPPRFYMRKLAAEAALDPPEAQPGRILSAAKSADELIKRKRKRAAITPEARWNATPARLRVREVCLAARMSRLKRSV